MAARNDDAVTSLVGTLLGIAILVVLVVAVAFLLQMLQEKAAPAEPPPLVGWQWDDSERTAMVVKTPPEAELVWGDDVTPGLVASCTTGSAIVQRLGEDVEPGTAVAPGDVVSGCEPGDFLIVVDTTTGVLVVRHRFPG